MKEEYLHYIFKMKQLGNNFITTNGEKLVVLNFGYHNHSSGPDFLECKLKLGKQVWAGQIEFHVKSSDWFKHKHQVDSNYNNVIAHFVYEHDLEIESGGYKLPTVVLKKLINSEHYHKYSNFMSSKNWIACQNEIENLDSFIIFQQKEKALFNRLTRKSTIVLNQLSECIGDQSEVFYALLFKAFGSKINQIPFEHLASKFDVKMVVKLNNDVFKIQAYLFGIAGYLNDDSISNDGYFKNLKSEFLYLKQLYKLEEMNFKEWKFSGVRPANYPTVRLAQLIQVLIKSPLLIKSRNIKLIIESFNINLDGYWKKHYMFGRIGKKVNSNLTNSFIDLIIINVYVPYFFSLGIYEDNVDFKTLALTWLENSLPEKNSVIVKWRALKIGAKSAFDSQALIELKNQFCDNNQCLNCKIGQNLLKPDN